MSQVKDPMMANEYLYQFNDNQSDSGEDFDYGDEDGESEGFGQSNNIDLMDYISNLDVSGF
jgi:hypothetical protein